MQTFLPYLDFKQTAECLDPQRLGNQRSEARTILNSIETKSGWYNHPACKMWEGYESALKLYFNTISEEWIRRGNLHEMGLYSLSPDPELPWWLGLEQFHSPHRASLLAKLPEWYSQFGWREKPEIGYWWPV